MRIDFCLPLLTLGLQCEEDAGPGLARVNAMRKEHRAASKRIIGGAALERETAVDPEWLSDTIGAIYDCALQPERWRATIELICRKLEFANALLGIIRLGPETTNHLVNVGMDYADRFPDYLADSIELWGGRTIVEAWPLDEPAVASQLITLEHKRKNRYYIDILEPRGFTDGAVLILAREVGFFCNLGLNRHVSVGDVTPEVVDALRLLAPHIRRAVTIGNLLDLKAVERETFQSVLAAMSHGVILVGEDLGIVHANPAAIAILSRGELVIEMHGKLQVRGPYAQPALDAAVQWAAQDESRMARRGLGVPAQGTNGETAVLHVLPLNRGAVRHGMIQRAVAAVFFTSTQGAAHMPLDAISLLYDLTPAEAQIFASLAKGVSIEATAKSLGTAKSTARTHLLRIFDKTGCRRQAELVALAARHQLPL